MFYIGEGATVQAEFRCNQEGVDYIRQAIAKVAKRYDGKKNFFASRPTLSPNYSLSLVKDDTYNNVYEFNGDAYFVYRVLGDITDKLLKVQERVELVSVKYSYTE